MASVHLPAEPRSVRAARVFVARELGAVGLSSSLALLLTSELASNVVQHARTGFELVVDLLVDLVVDPAPTRVRVEIHDGVGATIALRELIERHPGLPAFNSVHGRGLLLLTSTAAACGVIDKGQQGKVVWFEVVPEAD